ncbi:MAG: hypothetical protein WCY41_01930 [Candidatus Micrarchaeia archaeon]
MKFYSFPMLACAFLMLSALPSVVFADVIMPGTHAVDRCVKATNLDSYPDIYLIGEILPVGNQAPQLYFIESDKCLSKGYKFNTFNIYWAKKNYVDSLGGLGGINVSSRENILPECGTSDCPPGAAKNIISDSSLHFITNQIEPYGGFVPDTDTKTNETLEYRLECAPFAGKCMNMLGCSANCNLTLSGGDVPPQPPAPTPLGTSRPLEAFWCWLTSLFGGKC